MISELLLGMTFCHVPIDGVSLCSSKPYSVNRMLDLSSSSCSPGSGSGGLSVCKNWEQCLWTGEASHCWAGLVLCDPSAFVLCQCTAHSFTSRAHTLPQPNMGCFAPVRVTPSHSSPVGTLFWAVRFIPPLDLDRHWTRDVSSVGRYDYIWRTDSRAVNIISDRLPLLPFSGNTKLNVFKCLFSSALL